MRKRYLNYNSQNPKNLTVCTDEITSIGSACFQEEPYTPKRCLAFCRAEDRIIAAKFEGEQLHQQYPAMKGAIYLEQILEAKITGNVFKHNGAGPVFDQRQTIGLLTPLKDTVKRIERASAIFIADLNT